MFAPHKNPAGRPKGQDPRFKDVVVCENSPAPLTVPSELIATIWDQVNQGLRAVPRGGVEVGGLILGSLGQTNILAEAVIPIPIEYHFGPSFHLSPSDLKAVETLMASLQKDPSNRVVGFYRSRTRTDSLSEESESALLAVLEQTHASFAADFHYFVAFTPLSKTVMTASASFRKEAGWDDWQHVWLLMNPRPASQSVGVPPTTPQARSSPPEHPSATTAGSPPAESYSVAAPPAQVPLAPPPPPTEPVNLPYREARAMPPAAEPYSQLYLPDSNAGALSQTAQPHFQPHEDWAVAEPLAVLPQDRKKSSRMAWYVAGAILLAAVALGTYIRMGPPARISAVEQPATIDVASSAPATVSALAIPRTTGFLATREGALWKLTWDRAAVDALHPTGAVLSIRDAAKQKEIKLTPSDLNGATIFYEPHSNDLLFSLNIVMPGGQVAEEHVRVLEGAGSGEPKAEPSSKIEVREQVQTLRPFTPTPNRPKESSGENRPSAEVPAPPVLTAAPNQTLTSVLPLTPAAPAPLATAVVSKPPSPPETSPVPPQPNLASQLAGSWDTTLSQSPFATESATISVTVLAGDVNGRFLGKYKIPKNGPAFKQPVNFEFRGNLNKDRLPDGAWAFSFKSADGFEGNIKLRPQGSSLDVTWKASLEDGKTYTFEHVMGREDGK